MTADERRTELAWRLARTWIAYQLGISEYSAGNHMPKETTGSMWFAIVDLIDAQLKKETVTK